jgi:hypothetical protein
LRDEKRLAAPIVEVSFVAVRLVAPSSRLKFRRKPARCRRYQAPTRTRGGVKSTLKFWRALELATFHSPLITASLDSGRGGALERLNRARFVVGDLEHGVQSGHLHQIVDFVSEVHQLNVSTFAARGAHGSH